MTTNFLVPLDGSSPSEQALPVVKNLATLPGSSNVELLYVIEPHDDRRCHAGKCRAARLSEG